MCSDNINTIMSEKDYCEGCDYSPVAFGSRNKCPVHDKGFRDKKRIPLGKKCEYYYNSCEVFEVINAELEEQMEKVSNDTKP